MMMMRSTFDRCFQTALGVALFMIQDFLMPINVNIVQIVHNVTQC